MESFYDYKNKSKSILLNSNLNIIFVDEFIKINSILFSHEWESTQYFKFFYDMQILVDTL